MFDILKTPMKIAGSSFLIGGLASAFVFTLQPNIYWVVLGILDFILAYFCFTWTPEVPRDRGDK